MSTQDMEGYDELMTRLLDALPPAEVMAQYAPEQRLAGLAPEQRLAGLAPEQRLAGLDRDQKALALPIELLRVLPDAYVLSLAPEVPRADRADRPRPASWPASPGEMAEAPCR